VPLRVERLYPVVGAIIAGVAYLVFFRTRTFPPTLHELFAAVISVGAISVGFLATAKTILVSLSDRPVVQKLRDMGYYRWVVDYIIEAINWSFAIAALSAAGLLLQFAPKGADQDQAHMLFLCAWWVALVGASLAYLRVVRILTKILRQSSD
jgi:hypothetical protein